MQKENESLQEKYHNKHMAYCNMQDQYMDAQWQKNDLEKSLAGF